MTFVVTHGGISAVPDNFMYMATEQLIKGVGRYEDASMVADSFLINRPNDKTYQIHGHRNIQKLPVRVNESTFNLEGQVEFGEYLRVVTIDEAGKFEEFQLKNDVFRQEVRVEALKPKEAKDVEELVQILRSDEGVMEKRFGNIASFNFKRSVFFDRNWNARTITARGLFINTNTNDIVARSYNKFFNINEFEHCDIASLSRIFQFPVTCYRKENGFLGIVGYNAESDGLVITAKTSISGDFQAWFSKILYTEHRRWMDMA